MLFESVSKFIGVIRRHRSAQTAEDCRKRFAASPVHRNPVPTERSAPLVSIITVVRNAEDCIEKAILSVLEQEYRPLEYIIIDGASTDGTLEIIERYVDQLTIVLSEPDQGIYDAFNKGYALSSGDYIGYLNADDWMSKGQILSGMRLIEKTDSDFCFGDMRVHYSPIGRQKTITLRPGDPNYADNITFSMPELFQTTWLCSRHMFESIGMFKTNFHIAADYDWILRAHRAGFVGAYSNDICGNMRFGGISMTQQELAILEGFYASIINGGPWLAATRHWAPILLRNIFRRIFSSVPTRS